MTDDATTGDLTETLRGLVGKVEGLQSDVRRLSTQGPLPRLPEGDSSSYAWVGALDAPVRRPPQVPRLLLEVLFLVACAAVAALAELDGVAIAGVMVGAWVLVALIEWAASRTDARPTFVSYASPPQAEPRDDPAWFVPPVEHTLLETDSVTAITPLPPPPPADAKATVERRA